MEQYIGIGAIAIGFLILLIVVFFALVTRFYVKSPADRT